MKFPKITRFLPDWKSAALAVLSAILLILAFPDFEFWFLAWFALVPLLLAIEREKESSLRSFIVGWVFGTIFFFGTCWWLTFAPITYAGFPAALAYFLMFGVAATVGVFPAIFAVVLSVLLNRFGDVAILAAPVIWVFTEFLRYWLTGNNWNAVGYSQFSNLSTAEHAAIGGVLSVSFAVVFYNLVARNLIAIIVAVSIATIESFRGNQGEEEGLGQTSVEPNERPMFALIDDNPDEVRGTLIVVGVIVFYVFLTWLVPGYSVRTPDVSRVIAVQPNVPMAGLTNEKWKSLRQKHIELAESALSKLPTENRQPITVIFPESPMNFAYEEDEEFQRFVHAFAAKHDVNVLFNSAEPDAVNNKYFNSAVLVGPQGTEIAQYDKIYLVPFGESVPAPLQSIVPAFVGSFSYGSEYDLVPLGDTKAGIMICFESHFGQLSREYVQNGADVLIEMTNDGYLGPTPILRQHLANAVFRAVETNRPVLRVTNVGITAYINERGQVIDPAASYTEDTRIWTVSNSDKKQTFYVRYGDWFAWLCSVATIGLLIFGIVTRRRSSPLKTNL